MTSKRDNPPRKRTGRPSLLDRIARTFADPGKLEVAFDTLTPILETPTICPLMNTTPPVKPHETVEGYQGALERLSFQGLPDAYLVVLRAPGIPKKHISIKVMRTHALVTVTAPAGIAAGEGNVVRLFPRLKNTRATLQFADPVKPRGHSAKLKDGILSLRFVKETRPNTEWSESLDIE